MSSYLVLMEHGRNKVRTCAHDCESCARSGVHVDRASLVVVEFWGLRPGAGGVRLKNQNVRRICDRTEKSSPCEYAAARWG